METLMFLFIATVQRRHETMSDAVAQTANIATGILSWLIARLADGEHGRIVLHTGIHNRT